MRKLLNGSFIKNYFSRILGSHKLIKDLVSFLIRNKKIQLLTFDSSKRYLNCGCGPYASKEFINLDRMWQPGVDLCWDVTKKLPFLNNSIKGIYSEHMLEHLPICKATCLLSEFKRVLIKDGTLRIVVPDAELYLDLYQSAKRGKEVSFPNKKDSNFTPLMYVNDLFRAHGHQYAYDFELLRVLLKQSGFLNVTRESFNQGRDAALLIDLEWRKAESLYLEAVI